MITNVAFYRVRAAEAARQAIAAGGGSVRDRCERFAGWWSAIGDALEAGDVEGARLLSANVIYLNV